jgi:dTDP-4-dehydrorhamnose reductase
MKILLIGANGQLGSDIAKVFWKKDFFKIIPVNRPEVDITNYSSVKNAISNYHPEIVISTAAFHRVDQCEKDLNNSFSVNAFGVGNLASICQQNNIVFVHFSTDYVFGADSKRISAYAENDMPGPVNVYGISKLAGEYFIKYSAEKFFIIRTCGLYGVAGPQAKGDNFVDSIIKKSINERQIAVVNDQIATPTSTLNLATNLHELLKTSHFGLYHMTNEGECSWYEFAQEIVRLIGAKTKIIPVSSASFYSQVKRPHYSVLENYNLKKINLNKMESWKTALKKYLVEKNHLRI